MIDGEFINEVSGAGIKPADFAVVSRGNNDVRLRPDYTFNGAVVDVGANFSGGCRLMEIKNAELLLRASRDNLLGIRVEVDGANNMIVG